MNNIWLTWGQVFNDSLQNLWWSFVQFAPKLVIAVVLFAIGWFLGNLVAKAFEHVFEALKVDKGLGSLGVDSVMKRAGMNLNSGLFVGQVVKWFVVIVFLLPSLNLVLGEGNEVSLFLKDDVLMFLPRVVVAALILIIAAFVAEGLAGAASASAKSMGAQAGNMVGTVAKYAVWIFAFVIALGPLGVAEYYMSVLFAGLIGMLALGAALAFGLGG